MNTRDDLANYDNLELAWKRLQTSKAHNYKSLCKEVYTAFSWNVRKNLILLSSEIKQRIYKPSKSSKFYLPKASGLVRPITILNIKDQIYYQAIVNLICQSKLNDLKQYRHKNVFGGFNILSPLSIHFLSDWKKEYKLYQNLMIEYFKEGNIWLARFDLASFYDVIDHQILIDLYAQDFLDDDLITELYSALAIWTQPQNVYFSHSQGIPQGPVASVVLADIYLHLLDRKILNLSITKNIKYLRYVDDIVLMGKDEKSLKKCLIQLDITARELSLIPQSGKTLVKKVDNIKDEIKGKESLFEILPFKDHEKSSKLQKPLKKLFLESVELLNQEYPICIKVFLKIMKNTWLQHLLTKLMCKMGIAPMNEERKIRILNETNTKFALKRLLPDSDIISHVVKIIIYYSHLTDVCVSYLKQEVLDYSVSEIILQHIISEPNHDWHTAQLIKLIKVLETPQKLKLKDIIAKYLLNTQVHWILKKSIILESKHFDSNDDFLNLIVNELQKTLEEYNNNLLKQLPLYVSMLAISLDYQQEITLGFLDKVKLPDDFYIFIGYYAKSHQINLPNHLQNHSWIKNFYDEYDPSIDGISYGLVTLYDLPESYQTIIDLRNYFENDEFESALYILCTARGKFEKFPEEYITHVDTFNQILLSRIYNKDNLTNISNQELSNMIGKLKTHIIDAYSGFHYCHELRCKIPSIHAYDQSSKQLNPPLDKPFQKRDNLKQKLAIAYKAIFDHIKENHL